MAVGAHAALARDEFARRFRRGRRAIRKRETRRVGGRRGIDLDLARSQSTYERLVNRWTLGSAIEHDVANAAPLFRRWTNDDVGHDAVMIGRVAARADVAGGRNGDEQA